MNDEQHDHEETERAVWVRSLLRPDLGYQVTITYADGVSVTFDQHEAVDYAMELFTAAAQAAYDAAVLAQMTQKLDLPLSKAGELIRNLRADRPPLDQGKLGVLTVRPSVSAATYEPFLLCDLPDHDVEPWQWTPTDVEDHATAVLQCYPAAVLDNAYMQCLTDVVGIEPHVAANIVGDLSNYRVVAP